MTGLTKRQAEVQQLIEQKLSAGDIATKLGVSVGTVNSHRARMRQRLADRPLTKREQEVADLISLGLTDLEISAGLAISARTVEVHRQKILAKLKARNTPHAMTILHEHATQVLQARISELEDIVAHLGDGLATPARDTSSSN